MNKFIIFTSFFIVASLHILLFLYYRNTQIITTIPSKNTQSLQLQLTKVKEAPKVIEKPAIEEIKEIPKKEEIKPAEIKKSIKPKKEKVQKKEEIKDITQEISDKTQEKEKMEEAKPIIKTEQITQKTNQVNSKIDYKEKILLDEYATRLRQEINKNKSYPRISMKLNEQGIVLLSFRVLKTGEFVNIRIRTSSNKERLDKAALNALYDTKEFEVFSKDINKEYLDFNLPLEFKLN